MRRSLLASILVVCALLTMNSIINVESFPQNTSADLVLDSIVYPDMVAIGDVNNDSHNDIVVGSTHAFVHDVAIYYQKADYSFDPSPSVILWSGEASSVALGDLNNNGLNDIATASWMDCTVEIFYQRDNNTFNTTPDVVFPIAPRPSHVTVADLNDDALNDVAAVNTQSAMITIFFQSTNNTFEQSLNRTLVTGEYPYFVLAEDLNGDGLTDIASANAFSDTVTIYY